MAIKHHKNCCLQTYCCNGCLYITEKQGFYGPNTHFVDLILYNFGAMSNVSLFCHSMRKTSGQPVKSDLSFQLALRKFRSTGTHEAQKLCKMSMQFMLLINVKMPTVAWL